MMSAAAPHLRLGPLPPELAEWRKQIPEKLLIPEGGIELFPTITITDASRIAYNKDKERKQTSELPWLGPHLYVNASVQRDEFGTTTTIATDTFKGAKSSLTLMSADHVAALTLHSPKGKRTYYEVQIPTAPTKCCYDFEIESNDPNKHKGTDPTTIRKEHADAWINHTHSTSGVVSYEDFINACIQFVIDHFRLAFGVRIDDDDLYVGDSSGEAKFSLHVYVMTHHLRNKECRRAFYRSPKMCNDVCAFSPVFDSGICGDNQCLRFMFNSKKGSSRCLVPVKEFNGHRFYCAETAAEQIKDSLSTHIGPQSHELDVSKFVAEATAPKPRACPAGAARSPPRPPSEDWEEFQVLLVAFGVPKGAFISHAPPKQNSKSAADTSKTLDRGSFRRNKETPCFICSTVGNEVFHDNQNFDGTWIFNNKMDIRLKLRRYCAPGTTVADTACKKEFGIDPEWTRKEVAALERTPQVDDGLRKKICCVFSSVKKVEPAGVWTLPHREGFPAAFAAKDNSDVLGGWTLVMQTSDEVLFRRTRAPTLSLNFASRDLWERHINQPGAQLEEHPPDIAIWPGSYNPTEKGTDSEQPSRAAKRIREAHERDNVEEQPPSHSQGGALAAGAAEDDGEQIRTTKRIRRDAAQQLEMMEEEPQQQEMMEVEPEQQPAALPPADPESADGPDTTTDPTNSTYISVAPCKGEYYKQPGAVTEAWGKIWETGHDRDGVKLRAVMIALNYGHELVVTSSLTHGNGTISSTSMRRIDRLKTLEARAQATSRADEGTNKDFKYVIFDKMMVGVVADVELANLTDAEVSNSFQGAHGKADILGIGVHIMK